VGTVTDLGPSHPAASTAPATGTAPARGAVPFDVARVREDFAILGRSINSDRGLAFLDSAASSQKPRQVLDALREVYETSYANVHRGVYAIAAEATTRFEGAREQVRDFINASSPREVIFTRGTTEGINLVAYSWGRANLGPGDVVVSSELEHHSNMVPWQQIA
jgi:cysteine desulfurase / selenocysteine lyase